MNNIYVETMPSACDECPCCNSDIDYGASCNLGAFDDRDCYCTTNKHSCCPLKPLTDRLAEERKKVVQEIKDEIKKLKKSAPKHDIGYDCDDVLLSYLEISEILDQIERNGNDNK